MSAALGPSHCQQLLCCTLGSAGGGRPCPSPWPNTLCCWPGGRPRRHPQHAGLRSPSKPCRKLGTDSAGRPSVLAASSPASLLLLLILVERSILAASSSANPMTAAGLGFVVAARPVALVVVALAVSVQAPRSGALLTWTGDPSPLLPDGLRDAARRRDHQGRACMLAMDLG